MQVAARFASYSGQIEVHLHTYRGFMAAFSDVYAEFIAVRANNRRLIAACVATDSCISVYVSDWLNEAS